WGLNEISFGSNILCGKSRLRAGSRFDFGDSLTHFAGAARWLCRELRAPAKPRVVMNVVVVESPAKAKTINKYLCRGYEVLAPFGHVRDPALKNGSVDPDRSFRMIWEVDPKAQKRLNEIAQALKGSPKLILATDPDREGEAISWHVLEVLKEKK